MQTDEWKASKAEWKSFSVTHSGLFFFLWQARLQNDFHILFFFLSGRLFFLPNFCISYLWEQPIIFYLFICHDDLVHVERVWWGVFQQSINPCQCCLICHPFRVYGVLSFWMAGEPLSPEALWSWRELFQSPRQRLQRTWHWATECLNGLLTNRREYVKQSWK